MTVTRMEVGAATPISTPFYTPNTETAVDCDAPVDTGVTASVTHVNGTVIVAAGTVCAHAGPNTGTYSITVPAQANPATVVAVFTGTFGGAVRTKTVRIQVIGAFLCDLADIRALDGLGNAQQYPVGLLIQKRDAAEDLFEQITGAWTKRYSLDVLDGDSTYRRAYMPVESSWVYEPNLSRRMMLNHKSPQQVLSVGFQSFDPVSGVVTYPPDVTTGAGGETQAQYLAANYYLYSGGEIERALVSAGWPRGVMNVQVEYMYGKQDVPPALRDALLQYIRHLVVKTTGRISDRATSIQSPDGTIMLGQAVAWDKPTGISEIDAVLLRYDERDISIA